MPKNRKGEDIPFERVVNGKRVMTNVGRTVDVCEGDIYEFVHDLSTRAGHTHKQGSRLELIEKTKEMPHGEIGEAGYNWRCRTDHGESIWATFEQCVVRGLFRRVYRVSDPPNPSQWDHLLREDP